MIWFKEPSPISIVEEIKGAVGTVWTISVLEPISDTSTYS